METTGPNEAALARWKQRFYVPYILGTEMARSNPTRGLVVTDITGIFQLYAWDVPAKSDQLRQLTNTAEGHAVGNSSISPDGRYVYYHKDQQGNEIGHFMRIPFEGGPPQNLTPDLPLYSSLSGVSLSKTSNRLAFVAADHEGFQLYTLDLSETGELSQPHSLYHSHQFSYFPLLSHNGELVVVHSTERSKNVQYSLLVFDPISAKMVNECWDGEASSLEAVAFSPVEGDLRLLASTNRSGVKRPVIWHPYTNERTDLELSQLTGDVEPLDWSEDGNSLLLCHFDRAVRQLYRYELTNQSLTRLDHPRGAIGFSGFMRAYFSSNDEIFATWHDSTHPSRLIALDGQTGQFKRTVLAPGEAPASRPAGSVTFTSSDGVEIQGWLSVPEGKGPFPTVLSIHGGPHVVLTEVYSPRDQSWLDHGFALLSINYRGSTSFGQEFMGKIWGDLGHWEMEDMLAARAWLVQQEIARPDQILLYGASYGGYLTLLGLGKRPDLWAGGIALVAIADWSVDYEDSSATLRGWTAAMFGGTPQEKPEQYRLSSPITYAENVKAPVLIIQGRMDSRTPARQVELYEAKMKALGKSIEVRWFDAGHYAVYREKEISDHELMLDFARRTIEGVE